MKGIRRPQVERRPAPAAATGHGHRTTLPVPPGPPPLGTLHLSSAAPLPDTADLAPTPPAETLALGALSGPAPAGTMPQPGQAAALPSFVNTAEERPSTALAALRVERSFETLQRSVADPLALAALDPSPRWAPPTFEAVAPVALIRAEAEAEDAPDRADWTGSHPVWHALPGVTRLASAVPTARASVEIGMPTPKADAAARRIGFDAARALAGLNLQMRSGERGLIDTATRGWGLPPLADEIVPPRREPVAERGFSGASRLAGMPRRPLLALSKPLTLPRASDAPSLPTPESRETAEPETAAPPLVAALPPMAQDGLPMPEATPIKPAVSAPRVVEPALFAANEPAIPEASASEDLIVGDIPATPTATVPAGDPAAVLPPPPGLAPVPLADQPVTPSRPVVAATPIPSPRAPTPGQTHQALIARLAGPPMEREETHASLDRRPHLPLDAPEEVAALDTIDRIFGSVDRAFGLTPLDEEIFETGSLAPIAPKEPALAQVEAPAQPSPQVEERRASVAVSPFAPAAAPRPTRLDRSRPHVMPTERIVDVAERTAPSTPASTGAPLSLRDVLGIVVESNLDIQIERAKELDRAFGVDLARGGQRPKVRVEASAGPAYDAIAGNGTDPFSGEVEGGVTLSYNLYDFGRTDYDILQAQRSLASAQAKTQGKAGEVVYNAFDALVGLSQVDNLTAANRVYEKRLSSLAGVIRANAADGNATEADVKRAESRIEAVKSALIELSSQRDTLGNKFERLTDIDAARVDAAALFRLDLTTAAMAEDDLLRNPELMAIRAEIASLTAQAEAARRSRMPSLDLETGVNYQSNDMISEQSDTFKAEVKLFLSFELYDGGTASNIRGQLLARRQEATLRLRRRERELREEAQNTTTFDRTGAEKTAVLAKRVEALEGVARLYRDQFNIGERSVFEVLESEADLLQARSELIAHAHDRLRTQMRQLQLTGDLVSTLVERL